MAKVPDTQENMARCLCHDCPSFPSEGGFFCAKGKSAKEITKRGCLCANCPNFGEYGLESGYFCITGMAK